MLNDSIFAYDHAAHKFTIDTQDIHLVGVYKLKLVAVFAERYYRQKATHSFKVQLIDYCANAVLSDPG